jgi:hypothetical protein
MASVEGIRRIAAAPRGPSVRRQAAHSANPEAGPGTGRALIAVAPALRSDSTPPISRRPSVNFLAHLIATAQQAPQTRTRRRAEPDVAVTSYRTVAADPAVPAGHRFERSC